MSILNSFSHQQLGRGLWKFNCSHLTDQSFIDLVTDFWTFWQSTKSSFLSITAWWDAGKARLQNKIRAFSRSNASTFRKRVSSLENSLFHLNRRLINGEDVNHLVNTTKAELKEAHRQQSRGARIRSNIQWAEEGEASTAYLFRLEKKRGQQRLITAIKNLGGIVVRNLGQIACAWIGFYGQLFNSQALHTSQQDYFLQTLTQKLSDSQLQLCEGALTEDECKKALDGMISGKSPGLDGFPAEFYRTFWSLPGSDYVEVLNHCYSVNKLSPSQRTGVITLLHKRGDRLEMKNWRPITLLCVDYKIAAKAIANRLLAVLHLVIHTDQSCGVPGRNPNENSLLLKDIVYHAHANNIGAAVFSLDQEKAFDRVEWSYLHRVLKQMNFGASFSKWVSLFYSQIFSSILVNGEQTQALKVTRGVRQGCPLSPLLYVIIAETVACAIRANPLIDGYLLPNGKRAKICQYADDTSIIIKSDHSLREVFSIFDRYELASGARLNVEKSHGLLIGSWKTRTDMPIPLDWSSAAITVLGSQLSNDGEEHWEKKLQQLDTIFSGWKSRTLSFHGRALIANTLGLSLFWYLLSFVCLPASTLKQINAKVFSFVWQKKREWLARS